MGVLNLELNVFIREEKQLKVLRHCTTIYNMVQLRTSLVFKFNFWCRSKQISSYYDSTRVHRALSYLKLVSF